MARTLTSRDIRMVRNHLGDAGIECHIHSTLANSVRFLIRDHGSYVPAGRSWFDVACRVILDTIDGVGIRFIESRDDGFTDIEVGW